MCGKMKFDGAMARALYDNVPESPEELAFRKGDILMVIEQDTGGLQGWWLCTLHGRQGIAPGNRLQLLEALPPQHTHHSPGSGKQEGLYQVPLGKQVHQVPQSSKVVTPMCMGQSYTYDQPLPIRQELYDVPSVRLQGQVASGLPGQLYDTPPIAHEVYSVPPCRSAAAPHEGSYDFPQPLRLKPGGIYDVPPSLVTHVSPGVALNKGVLSSGGGVYDIPPAQQSAGGQWEAYDIPRGTPPLQKKGVQLPREVTDGISHLSLASSGTSSWNVSYGEADAILRRVAGLQRAANNAVQVMLGQAASPRWRTVSFMEQHGAELRATADSLHVVLADLLLLGRRAMGGGSVTSQSGPQGKLRRQLHRLDDSLQIMQQSSRALDSAGWDLAVLAPPDKPSGRSDDLDRLLMVCRSVPDDVKQLASTLVGNWELLFRDRGGQQDWELPHESEPPTPPFPVTGDQWEDEVPAVSPEQGVSSWMEDYDYVHLQGKEEFERQQQELLDKENIVSKVPLEEEQLKQYKRLEQEVIRPVENVAIHLVSQHAGSTGREATLCWRDQQLLRFYSEQCDTHFATFLNAVDAFFSCVGAGQPPRVFVAHSKLVILGAHKLVFIGDTLSRQVAATDVAHRVTDGSNALCKLLKTVVGATKMAALRYPSTAALQEMVDRVTLLSHQAAQLKAQLYQTAGT